MNRACLLLCFFVSGTTGLLYEVVWIRLAGTVIGNTTYAIGTVVGVFMGGLALGAWIGGRAADRRSGAKLLALYGALEVAIAVSALAVPILLSASEPLFRMLWHALAGAGTIYATSRALLMAVVLIVPTTLMGATLPILTRYLAGSSETAAREAGRAYSVNTFGGVAGTLAAGFFLIPVLGLQMTTFGAVAANAAIGAICLVAARGRTGNVQPTLPPSPAAPRLPLVVSAVSGGVALIFQVVWTRTLVLSMGSTVHAFTLILTAFILGLAGGSALCSRYVSKFRNPVAVLGFVQTAIGLTALSLLPLLGNLPHWFSGIVTDHMRALSQQVGRDVPPSGYGWILYVQFMLTLVFVAVPAFVMGTVFPLACRLAAGADDAVGRSVGAVYTWNTLGSIAGSVAASFVLIPILGLDTTAKAAVCANFALAAVLLLMASPGLRPWIAIPALGLAGAWLLPAWDPQVIGGGAFIYGSRGMNRKTELVGEYWDAYGLVTVDRNPAGDLFLRINGKIDASTSGGDMITQLYVGHLPMLHHPAPRRVMVIGLGAGFTLGAVNRHPEVTEVDCVEVSPAVIRAALDHFGPHNGNVANGRGVRILEGDGRNAIAFAETPYDVVISQPSNLWLSGMANLFTRDFFQSVFDRLNPDGVFAQWIHAYRLSSEDFLTVLRTFYDVFPAGSVWEVDPGHNYVLLGAKESKLFPFATLHARMKESDRTPGLTEKDFPGALGLIGNLLADAESIRRAVGDGPILTDDRCTIEYTAPYSMYTDDSRRILQWLDAIRVAPAERTLYQVSSDAISKGIAALRESRRQVARAVVIADEGRLVEAIGMLENVASRTGGRDKATQVFFEEIAGHLFQSARGAFAQKPAVASRMADAIPPSSSLYPRARLLIGKAHARSGNLKEAEAHYKEALKADPKLAAAHADMAALHQERGEFAKAMGFWLDAIELEPTVARLHARLAVCLFELDMRAKALAACREALRLDPVNAEALNLRARLTRP